MDVPEHKPEVARLVVRRLLILAPFLFVGSYFLALVQGAPRRDALIVALAGLAFCLGVALLWRLRGAKSLGDVAWLRVVLRVLERR